MALDRPFDDGRVQSVNVAVSASTVSANIMYYLIFMFTAKRPLDFQHFRLDETAETDVSDQRGWRKAAELHTKRGWRKTAELHTSGATRPGTWRWGVKW